MSLLQLIHWVSASLAASTLAAMAGLITYRWILSRREKRETGRLQQLTDLALECLEEPERLRTLNPILNRRDRRLLVRALSNLLLKIRGEYANRIARILRELGVVTESIKGSQSRAWWKRMRACAALATFGEPEVILVLECCLEDPNLQVRLQAAHSLVELGAAPPVRTLLEKLSVGTRRHSLAVNDLFRKLGPRAVTELIAALETDLAVGAKLVAIDALGQAGDIQAVPALVDLRYDSDDRVRAAIWRVLGLLADASVLWAAVEALEDPAWQVRAEAAVCVGQLMSLEAVENLEDRLGDEQWWVRYRAADALMQLGIAGLVALCRAAGHPGTPAADMAQGILREHGLLHET